MEIKFADTVSPRHFKGLRNLRDALKGRFLRGLVIYTNVHAVPFEEDLFTLPVSDLWSG
jgi:hypothetical protein